MSGGWNWSDLLVHVAIGSSISAGNFPPEVPYFAGVPLTYHWFADFHGAIASTVAGLDIIPVYFASSALFAGVLALVVWALAKRLTDDRRVATIATILVVAGGGLGWIRLVGDVLAGAGDVVDLVSRTSYDNTWADGWPYFKIASIFGTGFLPHRATTLGLPGLVTAVLLVVQCLGRRPLGVLLAGVLAALLAPFQFFAFPATYLIVFLYVLTSGAWRARTVGRDAVLFLAPVILATPFIASAVLLQSDVGAFRFVAGWGEARFGDGPAAVAFFYLTNLGIPFVLAVIAAFTARALPNRWFLVAWMVALFIVPNVVVVSAVEFDMNKYFQIMWIAVAILAAWLIRRWPRPLIAAVLLVSALSPALIARLARAVGRRCGRPGAGDGRPLDRREHAGAVRLRDRCVHQLPGRPRRAPPDLDLRAVRLEPWLRPGSPRGRHTCDLLRRPRGGRRADGQVRRDVRALERRRAVRRRSRH